MEVLGLLGKPKKKLVWYARAANALGRSRSVAVFAAVVALLGGVRQARRRAARD